MVKGFNLQKLCAYFSAICKAAISETFLCRVTPLVDWLPWSQGCLLWVGSGRRETLHIWVGRPGLPAELSVDQQSISYTTLKSGYRTTESQSAITRILNTNLGSAYQWKLASLAVYLFGLECCPVSVLDLYLLADITICSCLVWLCNPIEIGLSRAVLALYCLMYLVSQKAPQRCET